MKIHQSILTEAVKRLRKVALTTALPVSSQVRCTSDALGTHFIAACGDRHLTITLPSVVGTSELSQKLAALTIAREKKYDFLVPIKTLCQVAKVADKGSMIQIEPTGFCYTTGGVEATAAFPNDVPPAPLEDFPVLPDLTWHSDTIPSDPFYKAIAEGLSHTSDDDTRHALQGMLYNEKGEVSATDGRRLFLREGLPPMAHEAIIPTDTCELVEENMTICFNEFAENSTRYIMFTKIAPSLIIRLVSKLVDGKFPNFRQVIPDPAKVKCKVLINSVELSALIRKTRVGIKSIQLEVNLGNLTIKGKHGSFSVPALIEGELKPNGIDEEIQPYISFDPDLFAEALDVGLNQISFYDTLSPCVFTSSAKPSVKIVLMPQRS